MGSVFAAVAIPRRIFTGALTLVVTLHKPPTPFANHFHAECRHARLESLLSMTIVTSPPSWLWQADPVTLYLIEDARNYAGLHD